MVAHASTLGGLARTAETPGKGSAAADKGEGAAAALRSCGLQERAGGTALIVDGKGEGAANWYTSYGAVPLKDKPLPLVMALITFAADLRAKGLL